MKQKRNASGVKPNSSRPLALGAALLVLGACAYGTLPPRIVVGRMFPVLRVPEIVEGMRAAEVRQILGEPFEVKESQEGKTWRFYAREQKDGVAYILGFIPKKRSLFVRDYELILVLEHDLVKRKQYEEKSVL